MSFLGWLLIRMRSGWITTRILTIGDFPVWNKTCDIYDNSGKPDPFWDELGLRFNDRREGTASVFRRTSAPTFTGARMPRGAGWR
jgi:hypothetical protein